MKLELGGNCDISLVALSCGPPHIFPPLLSLFRDTTLYSQNLMFSLGPTAPRLTCLKSTRVIIRYSSKRVPLSPTPIPPRRKKVPMSSNGGSRTAGPAAAAQGQPNHSGLIDSILAYFTKQYSVQPSRAWVSSVLESITPSRLQTASSNPSSLFATFDFRFKAADLAESVDHASAPECCFPANIANLHKAVVGKPAGGRSPPVLVQVVDVWDMGSSRIDTLDRIEMAERGEIRKGQQIIRVVDEAPADDAGRVNNGPAFSGAGVASEKSIGPHKLLLEDAKGERAYAFEYAAIDKVDLDMPIGTKMLLREVEVLRGTLLLEPKNTTVIGGKVEEMQRVHREARKEKLKSELQAIKEARQR